MCFQVVKEIISLGLSLFEIAVFQALRRTCPTNLYGTAPFQEVSDKGLGISSSFVLRHWTPHIKTSKIADHSRVTPKPVDACGVPNASLRCYRLHPSLSHRKNPMAKFGRHFIGKHPLFTNRKTGDGKFGKGVWWEDNIFYLWWSFLRLHEGYKKTCSRKGAGTYSKLYADFGDVHATDFKTWWNGKAPDGGNRGAYLFAEPTSPEKVMALSDDEAKELIENGRDQSILLIAVPLKFRRREISTALSKIINDNHGRKRGQKRVRGSQARYNLDKDFDAHSIKIALECHKLRLENPKMTFSEMTKSLSKRGLTVGRQLNAREEAALARDKKALASLRYQNLKDKKLLKDGISLARSYEQGMLKSDDAQQLRTSIRALENAKLALTSAVSRKLRIARTILANVADGKFPVTKG